VILLRSASASRERRIGKPFATTRDPSRRRWNTNDGSQTPTRISPWLMLFFAMRRINGTSSILRPLNVKLDMAKPDSLQGSLDLLVLKILSRRPRLHGYAIMSAIRESSGEVLRADEGSLYPGLHRMEEDGWIRAEWVTKDTGRRARIYELTVAGKNSLPTRRHAGASSLLP